jgi:hypothetical protein
MFMASPVLHSHGHAGLSNLQSLSLKGLGKVTEWGVQHLSALQKLQKLSFETCRCVSGLRALRGELPGFVSRSTEP